MTAFRKVEVKGKRLDTDAQILRYIIMNTEITLPIRGLREGRGWLIVLGGCNELVAKHEFGKNWANGQK